MTDTLIRDQFNQTGHLAEVVTIPAERMGMAERRRAIGCRVEVARYVAVTRLSAELGVSAATIRTDLRALESLGVLRRVHGGAVRLRRHPVQRLQGGYAS